MEHLNMNAEQLHEVVTAQQSKISKLAHQSELARVAWKDLILQQVEMYESTYPFSEKLFKQEVDLNDDDIRSAVLSDVEDCMSESDFEDIVDFDFDFSHHRGSMEIQTEVTINDREMQMVIEKIVMHTFDLIASKLEEGNNG